MRRAVALFAWVLFSCAPAAAPVGEGCPGACARLRACAIGRLASPAAAPCEEVCETVTREGIDFGTKCLTDARTCADARACQ